MKSIRLFLLLSVVLVLLAASVAFAETEAGDITSKCSVTVSSNKNYAKRMTTGDYSTFWTGEQGSVITIKTKNSEKAQGVSVSFHGKPALLTAMDMDGNIIGKSAALFENEYITFDHAVTAFTLVNSEEIPVEISKLRVVEAGELPSWVQMWNVLDEDADMMLISTHPDDELLWFGGMLPTYAGELDKKVMVIYMVGGNNAKRKNELLDGLWTCGVKYYPEIGCFEDKGASSRKSVIHTWGEGETEKRIVDMLRKYRPKVVVTQDINGEYGHFHHIVTVEAAIKAVTELAMDASFSPETAVQYGVWSPMKLYLHLYEEDRIIFNWQQPLERFQGKTSLQIAKEAFKKHISQQNTQYAVNDSGRLNCSIFGLYYSTVGKDVLRQDLFENIE